MGDIIQLKERYVARCTCGGSQWEICVDKPGEFEIIRGIQCSNCDEFIAFEMKVVGRKALLK